ncbi:putative F-box protein [Citrus sinensis]|nr:putative F-box protein [Citrus sinensis]
MLDISYGGVTKSWSIQTKQCNSQAMIQQPRLELHDVKEDTKFKFSTTFLQGEWAWNVCNAKTRPIPAPWKHYVGYSDGALVSRGASPNEYYLHFPEAGEPYHLLPSWDPRIPKKQGAEYAWMKQDSAIPDPNCNSYKSERNRFMRFTNAIAHKGKFYALSLHGTLGVIEDIDHFKECLLESDGDILLIFLISRKSVNIVDDVEVFRLDVNTLSWIKIGRLGGDSALFLGSNCFMSVSASKMGCKSDCVYFSHHREDDWWVYDLQRGSISLCRSHEISHKICR